jgi:hypothetical protein
LNVELQHSQSGEQSTELLHLPSAEHLKNVYIITFFKRASGSFSPRSVVLILVFVTMTVHIFNFATASVVAFSFYVSDLPRHIMWGKGDGETCNGGSQTLLNF